MATWPRETHAQQSAMPVIGLVNSGPPEAAGYRAQGILKCGGKGGHVLRRERPGSQ